jgi:hypothetical protein
MIDSPNQLQADPQTRQRRKLDQHKVADHGGRVIGTLLGAMLKSLVTKVTVIAVLALIAYFGVARVAHLPSVFNPHTTIFTPHTTITAAAVMTKLTEIEQVHVATATFKVDDKVTQSVEPIPCFFICNKMQLQGTGTDDDILDLSTLSQDNVEVNPDRSSVILWITPPAIGPADLDPVNCSISSSHGILNGPTQGIHNNPNGYRPLFAEAETQIHDQALRDPALLAAGEQSTRALLTRILRTIGVKEVTVNFV